MLRTVLALTLLAASLGVAEAQQSRKIDFTTVLMDEDNNPLWECADPNPVQGAPCANKRNMTLGRVAFRSLATPDSTMKPEEGWRRGILGLSLLDAKQAEVSTKDIVLIKELIAKTYGNSPLLLARCFPLLDPSEAAPR